jgi:uncharacterized protein YecT (DUF1311 family)
MKKLKIFLILIFIANFANIFSQTQAEMNNTAIEDYNKIDIKLNKLYKQILKLLESPEKELFVQAQRDWIKFKESQCRYQASSEEGGSIQPLIKYVCLTELTDSRIKDFEQNIKDLKR